MIPADVLASAIQTDQLEELAAFCDSRQRRIVTIDGFMGSGKTTLAERLSARLGCSCLSLDSYLPDSPDDPRSQLGSYAEKLDLEALKRNLDSGRPLVVEGAFLRDVIGSIVGREDRTDLYLARCSKPAVQFIWHDGHRIEDGGRGGTWIDRAEVKYHRRQRPDEDADAIVVRIEGPLG